jgi:hypothetical protein
MGRLPGQVEFVRAPGDFPCGTPCCCARIPDCDPGDAQFVSRFRRASERCHAGSRCQGRVPEVTGQSAGEFSDDD